MQPIFGPPEVSTPDLFKYLWNWEHAVEVHGQEIKDLGFVLRQLQNFVIPFDHMGLSVEHVPPDRYPTLHRRPSLLPAVLTIDMGMDPCHETGD